MNGFWNNPKSLIIACASVVCLIFLFQNTQVVSVRFLFWQISMSQIILILMMVLIGFVMGFIVGKKSGEY